MSMIGRIPDHQDAVLIHYERKRVGNAPFPGIHPKEYSVVSGLLLRKISPNELARFDTYEGEGHLYHRKPVHVYDPRGNEFDAQTYIFGDPKLLIHDWIPDENRMVK